MKDPLFEEAKMIVIQYNSASAKLLRDALRINFTRANKILNQLEQEGVVGPHQTHKPRSVLI
jgi:S-DNA-T family DNA segregation ATPase FtsK/SpoIIIE